MSVREKILIEIRRIAAANGGQPPGSRAFTRETGIRESSWRGVEWARWGDALQEAGFAANERQGKLEADYLFEKYVEACRHFKHLATAMELRMYGRAHDDFPNQKTFHARFGSKEDLLANLRAWIAGKDAYEDIGAMLGPAGFLISR